MENRVDAGAPQERPLVYFLCIGNAIRSQIAEAFLRHYAGDRFDVASAGVRPAGYILPETIAVMREIGIDVRHHASKKIDKDTVARAALVIDLGGHARHHLAHPFRAKLQEWPVPDPYGRGHNAMREARDQIDAYVQGLIAAQAPIETIA